METPDGSEVTSPIPTLGATLVNEIESRLGRQLDYPDAWGELEVLRDNLTALTDLQLDPATIDDTWDKYTLKTLKQATLSRVEYHQRKLVNGSLLVEQPDGTAEWQDAPPKHRSNLKAQLTRIDRDLEQRPDDDYPSWSFDETCSKAAESSLYELVIATVDDLSDLIPEPRAMRNGTLGRKVGRILLKHTSREAMPYSDKMLDTVSDLEDRRISRTVQKINKLFAVFLEAPYDWICEAAVDFHRETIEEEAVNNVDLLLSQRNTELLNSRPATEPRRSTHSHRRTRTDANEHSKPAPAPKLPEKTSPPKQQPNPTPPPGTEPKVSDKEIDVTAATVKLLGDFQISVPWISEGSPEPMLVEQVELNGNPAYITRCFSTQLEAISDEVRANTSTKLGEPNPYDTTAQQVAKQIAYGILPRQSTHNIKRLDTNGPTEAYGSLPIWYTFDVSPNAPRVYFVIKKMGDIAREINNGRENIEPDANVVVVIAETDKHKQTDALQAITGQSHQHLRNRRTGAI